MRTGGYNEANSRFSQILRTRLKITQYTLAISIVLRTCTLEIPNMKHCVPRQLINDKKSIIGSTVCSLHDIVQNTT
jgi:hypothetical protein